jgi:hypothetical protein
MPFKDPEVRRRYFRDLMRRRRAGKTAAPKPQATKPSVDSSVELKLRISELEARIRELESKPASAENSAPISVGIHVKPFDSQNLRDNVGKMIRMLGASEDGVVLAAARKLASTKDLHALAQVAEAWEKQEISQQPAKKPVQI